MCWLKLQQILDLQLVCHEIECDDGHPCFTDSDEVALCWLGDICEEGTVSASR